MESHCTHIPYSETGFFSRMVNDYLNNAATLQPFYQHTVSPAGIKAAIAERKKFMQPRAELVSALKDQYVKMDLRIPTVRNIEALENENTFTVRSQGRETLSSKRKFWVGLKLF